MSKKFMVSPTDNWNITGHPGSVAKKRGRKYQHFGRALTATMSALILGATSLLGIGAHHLITAENAQAAPRVQIQGPDGSATVSASGTTDISVRGTGFQSINGGFGGIYVVFGTVKNPNSNSWKPSNGGQTGVDYIYVPDTEAKDNAGYQRFVTFPGSGTASAANGGELKADGTWSLTMRTPGAKFRAFDRDGNAQEVDCTQETCGIITIGAHGVSNASNETFTPVSFTGEAGETVTIDANQGAAESQMGGSASQGGGVQANPQQAEIDALAEAQGSDDTESSDTDASTEETDQADIPEGFAELELQQQAVQAGNVLGFTGSGFRPGEQVVATLGTGSVGAGPLVAGETGEIAAAIPIPEDTLPGSHILRGTGAGSGQTVQAEFTVILDAQAAAAEDERSGWSWGLITLIIVAGLILAFIITSVIMTLIRRNRAKKAATPELQHPQASGIDEIFAERAVEEDAPTGRRAYGNDETEVFDSVGPRTENNS
ncbi:MAG: hypothetical protein ACTH1B_02350 [Yaniella sp.]|uniref:hypothetical protein n=1 Tax=Yaniella sp. TaxID=2773929 RepID=UPI003F9A6A64